MTSNATKFVGQTVTLVGVARDAHLGAVVALADGTPVYVKGVESWDDRWHGKRVAATGTLRQRKLAPDPVSPTGEISHGMQGEAFVLENPSWQEATA